MTKKAAVLPLSGQSTAEESVKMEGKIVQRGKLRPSNVFMKRSNAVPVHESVEGEKITTLKTFGE